MASGAQRAVRLLFGVTFFLLGPCALAWALISAYRTHAFLQRSVTAQATIVRLNAVRSLRHRTVSYEPVFTFTADDGRSYTIASNFATSPPAFKVGEHATAHYEKGHPEQARLNSFAQLWIFDVIDGAVGALFTLLFICVIFARARPPRVYKRSDLPMTADQR